MKKKWLLFFAVIAWIIPLGIVFHDIYLGNIPFWYDPARDMLGAWDNLHKITLIGPPTGIPGIFYGPYWIWLLSFGELISKNPRVVDLIVQTIPYFILFPLTLYFFSKIFSPLVSILLWLVFFWSSSLYTTYLWNPDLSPLLFLVIIYILSTRQFQHFTKRLFFEVVGAGILTGLVLNINLSLSIGIFVGCLIYLVSVIVIQKGPIGRKIIQVMVLVGGFVSSIMVTFLPFFLFEARHGFTQTKTALVALLHGGGVVGLQGLSKSVIFVTYVGKFSDILLLPMIIGMVILILGLGGLIGGIVLKKFFLTNYQKQILILLICISVSVLGIYLNAKNPIWSYHFIGVEIIWLLLIGILATTFRYGRYLLFIWVIYISVVQVGHTVLSYKKNPLTVPNLSTKEYIVKSIMKDAKENTFTVFVYSPSIYTYDYEYLFKWMAGKDFSYDPGQIRRQGVVYLVLPPEKKSALEDFIHYRTPDMLYTTNTSWSIPDGTHIIKRLPRS